MRKVLVCWALVCGATLTLGASHSPVHAAPSKGSRTPSRKPAGRTARKPARKPAAGKKPTPKAPVSLEGHPLIARLTQVESGPGIVVFEPVAREADAETADFGAGCARWMNLVVGGQPEFGRTPLWSQVGRVPAELKRTDLRLTLGDALLAARKLGLTHVAVGEIQGNLEKCTLTYRVVTVTGKKPLGEPISVTAPAAGVSESLTGLAAAMIQRLGVAAPRLYQGPGETPAELAALGRVPWAPAEPLTAPQRGAIYFAAENARKATDRPLRPVLGTFLCSLYMGAQGDGTRLRACLEVMNESLGTCPLVLAEVPKFYYNSKIAARRFVPITIPAELVEKYPNNYALATAQLYLDRLNGGNLTKARSKAEHAVRCARAFPEAWLILSGVLGQRAEQVRLGRFASDLDEEEARLCNGLYAEQLPLGLKAVELDPGCVAAWRILSGSAALLGEEQLADAACARALDLDPVDFDGVAWAVQLYQPHWLDDRNKLLRVAQMAVERAAAWTSGNRVEMAIDLHHARLPDLAEKVLKTDDERREYADHLKTHQ